MLSKMVRSNRIDILVVVVVVAVVVVSPTCDHNLVSKSCAEKMGDKNKKGLPELMAYLSALIEWSAKNKQKNKQNVNTQNNMKHKLNK